MILARLSTITLFLQAVLLWKGKTQGLVNKTESVRPTVSFRLGLFEKPYVSRAWIKYPKSVPIGSPVYVQISPGSNTKDPDLRTIPQECYLARTAAPDNNMDRFMLITSGCPFENTVVLQHTKARESRLSRFSFTVRQIYSDTHYMFFHCQVTACSLTGNREHEGFIKCPSNTYCSERQRISSASKPQTAVEDPVLGHLNSGPLRPIVVTKPSMPIGFAAPERCPPCKRADFGVKPDAKESVVKSEENEAKDNDPPDAGGGEKLRMVFVQGHRTEFVVVMALTCFILGVALMGAIWWIHTRTDERRLRGENGNSASSLDSAPTPPLANHSTSFIHKPRLPVVLHLPVNHQGRRRNSPVDSLPSLPDSGFQEHHLPPSSLLTPLRLSPSNIA